MGLHRDPADEAFLTSLLARACEALGEPAFTAAKAAGRAMDYEATTGEVRAWLSRTFG